jgi:regulatory protein
MRITKIEKQKRHPERRNIYADDRFLLGVSDETLIRHGIRTGDEIEPAALTSLLQTEELLNAKRAALRYLSYRPRTEREVRDKLREQDFPDHEISATIDDLKRAKLLDDEAFAQMYVRDALALRASGRLLLKRKLLLLGVGRTLVDQVLDEAFVGVDQIDVAHEAARKLLNKTGNKKVDAVRMRNKVSGFLARRGYTWDVIEPVLNMLFKNARGEKQVE